MFQTHGRSEGHKVKNCKIQNSKIINHLFKITQNNLSKSSLPVEISKARFNLRKDLEKEDRNRSAISLF